MLDMQIKHLDQKFLENLEHWLNHHWYYCQRKMLRYKDWEYLKENCMLNGHHKYRNK
jgi:hypothetical protein